MGVSIIDTQTINLLYLALAAVLVVLFLSQIPGAAAPVTPTAAISLSSPYNQNFDTLAVSGTEQCLGR